MNNLEDLGPITSEKIAEGERAVREGRTISLKELKDELFSLDHEKDDGYSFLIPWFILFAFAATVLILR